MAVEVWRRRLVAQDGTKQFTDGTVRFYRVTQMRFRIDQVAIPASFLHAFKNVCLFQVSYDAQRGSLCDANPPRHIPQPHVRIVRNAREYMRVIAEKAPARNGASHNFALVRNGFPEIRNWFNNTRNR
jgi:hypothetical protein